VVDPEIAAARFEYRLRWDQSPIDFATEVAEEIGATVKPAGGKLVVMKRGGSKSGSGQDLAPIRIERRRCYDYDIEVDPRTDFGNVATSYHDPKSGRRKLVKQPTGREGPYFVAPHLYRSEIDAREAAEAQAYALGHNSGSGHFEVPGLPDAWAEAPVNAEGFGFPIDGAWKCESLDLTITSRGGFSTTVNVKAGTEEKGKSKGKAKSTSK
jgi:uncharacterized protein